jgi:hypothetical protein
MTMFRYAQSAILAATAGLIGARDFGEAIEINQRLELPPLMPLADMGAYGGGKRDRRIRTSIYMPHQNTREKARRVRQMAAGQLSA